MNKSEGGIKVNDIVTIDYVARLENGKTVLSSKKEGPLTFKVGHFNIISGFNDALLGMKVGESKKCVIGPSQAYGEKKSHLINTIQLLDLPIDVAVGQQVMSKVNKKMGTVVEICHYTQECIVDENHLLAGERLTFVITVLNIRYPSSMKKYRERNLDYFRRHSNRTSMFVT